MSAEELMEWTALETIRKEERIQAELEARNQGNIARVHQEAKKTGAR